MSFGEKIEQLNEQIGATFDQAFSALRREVQDRLREGHEDLQRRLESFTPPKASPFLTEQDLAPAQEALHAAHSATRQDAAGELRDALAALDRCRTQAEVLHTLIGAAGQFSSRAALLLVRGGELHGWGAQGFDAASAGAVEGLVLTPAAGSAWQHAAGNAGNAGGAGGAGGADGASAGATRLSAADCAALCGRLESRLPSFGALVPLVLRDRVVAVLYGDEVAADADAGSGSSAVRSEAAVLAALQILVYSAALAIETLPFRQRAATATLVSAPAPPAPPAATAGAAEEAAEPPAATPPTGAADLADAPPAAPPAPAPLTAAAPAPLHTAAAEPEPVEATYSAAALGYPHGLHAPEDADTSSAPSAEGAAAAARDAFQPAAPFRVSPAALYDTPSVPLVQRTAELPRPWSALHPAEPADPAEDDFLQDEPDADDSLGLPAAAAGAPEHDAAPQAPQPPQITAGRFPAPVADLPRPAAANADNETVLLSPVSLRDGGAHDSVAPVLSGPGILRAVPPDPPAVLAGAAATEATETTELPGSAFAAEPPLASVTPLIPGQPPSGAAAFEPLRGGALGSATPEVRPPSGVQGPGWAFATSRLAAASTGDEALHEEARRLARLLVSEIKLYNEEQVEAGRRNRDIYERLREDIDRSRQMYEERVEPRVVRSTDYFYQELVRILAAGDAMALGV